MICIQNKQDCVGCEACVLSCPQKCISFVEDECGFRYPVVDMCRCVGCGICERVCPVINQSQKSVPRKVFIAKDITTNVLLASSSGGVFFSLAKKVLDAGGVVFGARFDDNWEVVHGFTEKLDGLGFFQTSKYSQSVIGHSYEHVLTFLKDGRRVLFSGTPCQIAGLRLFLRKDFGELLLTVDVACHGVPSPMVWRDYLSYVVSQFGESKNSIEQINFRDKRNGWKDYGLCIRITSATGSCGEFFECHRENLYMKGFLSDFFLRPACYKCPDKSGKSKSDITLADCWGIEHIDRKIDSTLGVSLVLANTQFGEQTILGCGLQLQESNYETAIRYNPSIVTSAHTSKYMGVFWHRWNRYGLSALSYTISRNNLSFIRRVFAKAKMRIGTLLNINI